MDLSECIHIGWWFSSSCHIPRERTEKKKKMTAIPEQKKKSGHHQLKVGAGGRKKSKKIKQTLIPQRERKEFFCVFISNFNYFQIKKSMSRLPPELDFFFFSCMFLPFFSFPHPPPPPSRCSDDDASDEDKAAAAVTRQPRCSQCRHDSAAESHRLSAK